MHTSIYTRTHIHTHMYMYALKHPHSKSVHTQSAHNYSHVGTWNMHMPSLAPTPAPPPTQPRHSHSHTQPTQHPTLPAEKCVEAQAEGVSVLMEVYPQVRTKNACTCSNTHTRTHTHADLYVGNVLPLFCWVCGSGAALTIAYDSAEEYTGRTLVPYAPPCIAQNVMYM
jgi:hypothetical protein